MKKFSSLLDAIHYMILCPMCQKRLSFDLQGFNSRTVYEYSGTTTNLNFYLSGDDIITVNVESGRTTMEYGVPDTFISYKTRANYYPSYQGVLFLSMGIICTSCSQYGYRIGIDVDLSQHYVSYTFLNSEFLNIEDGGMNHFIKNVYNYEQTEYSVVRSHSADITPKVINLPLIPMDFADPQATLTRVKKLVLFS